MGRVLRKEDVHHDQEWHTQISFHDNWISMYIILVSVEIIAKGSERLMGELCLFRYELEQLNIEEGSEAAYYQLCGSVDDRALDVLSLELVRGKAFGWKNELVEAEKNQSAHYTSS